MSDIRKYFKIDTSQTKSINDTWITIYTDGSALNNGKKNMLQHGGIGIYIEKDEICISEKLHGKITNNIAELKACIRGIKYVINCDKYNNENIKIYSDSEYVINSITKWALNWSKNNWQKYDKKKKGKCDIKNKELIIELFNLYNKYTIQFIHTKSHTVKPDDKSSKEYKIWYGNYMADKLAVMGSNS